ncbi:haloacid dehalogenase superfamily enzyme, subfamily IA [Desulfitobacterium dichloroeliminans LMG P-21439]|uniref:Haloacid dehalogenase superfamily enzyme, subfamily IA n=1 Tax=Desulfitobacterium dichloroeliminans (strain LMG P-21439 / DCA1) TaxID=871963 RepID=L0F6U4_DESDL|nr:HAD family hydrolase [Desulfitobacterium dichloroeliminans]AGA68381.1 haloacid dehalogenase superfamily enzyme, subfamily IA [Desulfitobacterium dichloroeliminans LMG P-21439]
MEKLANVDSIIFDLDGTLWDATKLVYLSWNQALEEYARRQGHKSEGITMDQIKSVMGLQIPEIGRKLFSNISEEDQFRIMNRGGEIEFEKIRTHGGMLYPHVEKTLEALAQSHKLFIVSNCQDGYIESFFFAHQLEKYFIDYENPGRTGLSKGENIKLIMERNHLQNPVYVGDTRGDAKAAQVAEIPFIFARYGFGSVESYAAVMDRFDQLLDIFS